MSYKFIEMNSKLNFWFLILITVILTLVQGTPTALPVEVDKNELKVVCYFHLHSVSNPDFRDYSYPEIIDENQCTHIIYSDRVRYRNVSSIIPFLHDGKKKFYQRIADFRKKGIPVLISFFRYNLYEHAQLLADADERTRFVASLIEFIEQYNFTGFNLYWGSKKQRLQQESPIYPDENSIDVMRTLSEAFRPRGWLLSIILHSNKTVIDAARLDIPKLSQYTDMITGHIINMSDNYTKYDEPLYSSPGQISDQLNLNWSINYLIENGVPAQKIILLISMYGRKYKLLSAQENGLNAPTIPPGGWSSPFYEICDEIKKQGWTVVHDRITNNGSYAYHDDEWISYNDIEDVQRKAEYVLQMKLGGGGISNLNGDDFQGICGCGKSPFLTALNQVLRKIDGPKNYNCT